MSKFVFFLLILSYFFILPKSVKAVVLFEDDFNQYVEDSYPTKWEDSNTVDPACPGNPWRVKSGHLSAKILSGGCASNIIPSTIELPDLEDYIFEVDIVFVTGADHNIGYRSVPFVSVYEAHFSPPNGDFSFSHPPGVINYSVGFSYGFNTVYGFKAVVNGENVKIYLNDSLVKDFTSANTIPSGKPALRISSGGGGITETWFDNVRITTLDHVDPQPEPGLPVPLLKQTDTLWGNDVYDSANLWSSDGTTISRWGCAITSASMVFQYNGLNTMVDSSDLNPGSINQWLKTQVDGYVRGGLLNWLSLSRLSKQISEINSAPFDALEYESRSVDNELLTNRIENSVPAILSVPGHFIVAKGVDIPNATYWINDPFYAVSSLSDPIYNNSYSRMGIYTQSNTDLSYIMLVVEPHIEIELLDNAGDPIETEVAIEMIDDAEGDSINSEGPIKVLYAKKPNSGEYQLYLKSTEGGDYTIDQYFYDQGGEVNKMSMVGNLTPGGTDEYKLTFDKDNSSLSFSEKVSIVTFESVKSKIVEAFGERKIKNKLTYYALITELELARKARTNFVKRLFLDLMIITISKSKTIDKTFGQELILDIKTLQSSL